MKWSELNLNALHYFVDAIELGSLTAAAEKNHVSRPAISQSIRRLEEIIGHELILHAKNRLELTEQGRSFLTKAKSGLKLLGETFSKTSEPLSRINVASSNTLAEFLVLPALKKLKLGDSRQIRLQVGTTSKVRQLIADGEANLGLIIDDEKTYGLESVSITKGQFALCSLSGRLEQPLITTELRPEVSHLMKTLKKRKLHSGHHMQMESWSICGKAGEALGGSVLLPEIIPRKLLKPIRDFKFSYEYEVKAIYKNSNRLSPAELELLKLLQK